MKKFCLLLHIFAVFLGASESQTERKLTFFNLDRHISVIADVKNIFESCGHKVESWNLSEHTWIFGKAPHRVEIYNENTAAHLNREMCNQFYERYREELKAYDAFIVTHTPSTALLYEKWHKPIIIVNSTRYEQPFTGRQEEWHWLNEYLRQGVESGRIFIVSNNKADQRYLKHYTGLDSELIPSLCAYTHESYTGTRRGVIFYSWSGKYFIDIAQNAFTFPQWIQNSNLSHSFGWNELYDFEGIVHLPYQISVMSLFEQYTANVPLFFPTKRFLLELYARHPDIILSQLSFFPLLKLPMPVDPADLNNLNNQAVLNFWIDSADYYDDESMPFIQYFDSFADLEAQLVKCNFQEVSQCMHMHNLQRKQEIVERWKTILQKIVDSLETETDLSRS
ncbi:MAG: hypothetical protein LLG04_06210 [Parachlamydia sp.]|nr:hypothetical protein [Parachlamydia sp.]